MSDPSSPPPSNKKLVCPGAPKKRLRHIAPTPVHSPVEPSSPRTPPPPEEKELICPGAPARKSSKIEYHVPAEKKLTRLQLAQKCAWCGRYLWAMDDLSIYDGPDGGYIGWIVHDSCNINSK